MFIPVFFDFQFVSLSHFRQHTQNRAFLGGGHSLTAEPSQAASTSREAGECSQSKRTNANFRATGATPKVPKWFKTGK